MAQEATVHTATPGPARRPMSLLCSGEAACQPNSQGAPQRPIHSLEPQGPLSPSHLLPPLRARHCPRSRSHQRLLLIPEPNRRHDRALLGDPRLSGLWEKGHSLFFLQLPPRRAAE